ncbi:MAG TPA: phage holin family protein [Steroidobacteraceae bacterium]|nr:phage holin family protein [Steroidobacteraceae bacterium]
MRGLWSLPKAAPALMRHIGAYVELAALDLARAQREITAQVVASAIAGICALFAVFMFCLGVVAYTWDTAYRVAAIAWMGGGFLVIAIAAVIYRSRLARARSPLLSDVKREWQDDRVILERILSSDEDRP